MPRNTLGFIISNRKNKKEGREKKKHKSGKTQLLREVNSRSVANHIRLPLLSLQPNSSEKKEQAQQKKKNSWSILGLLARGCVHLVLFFISC
jgi:hypothetical protein